jgi:DMSO/TMAO reductase YedYZ molybdopterin-dependent catalytic subunit
MSAWKAPRNPHALFTIEGDVQRPQGFSYLDLAEVHPYYQIADLSTVDEKLSGKAVRLRKLLDTAGPGYGTQWLTVESLDREDGGPVRFLVPYYPDACANVKAVGRILVSRERGRDTRPSQKAGQAGAQPAAQPAG